MDFKTENSLDSHKIKFGYPIVKVELEEEHFQAALQDAIDTYHLFNAQAQGIDKDIWIRKYTFSNLAETLSFIRGKYSEIPIPNGTIVLNPEALMNFAKVEKERLFSIINKK